MDTQPRAQGGHCQGSGKKKTRNNTSFNTKYEGNAPRGPTFLLAYVLCLCLEDNVLCTSQSQQCECVNKKGKPSARCKGAEKIICV